MMRRAGRYRHRVQLQAIPSPTATSTGFTRAWTTYARPYAAVAPAPAGMSERPVASTTQGPVTHLVEMDYHRDVAISHRVLLKGARALYIVGIQNVDELDKTLVLSCEERAA